MTALSASEGIEQWDLTATISPYLDRHMIFPLLDYLEKLIDEGTINYTKLAVSEARLALLRPTHMFDYAIDIYTSIHGNGATIPSEMETQKAQVLKDLDDLKQRCAPLEQIGDEEREKLQAAGHWNVAYLSQQNAEITDLVVAAYRDYARFKFDCGDYEAARALLTSYISLAAHPPPTTTTGADDNEDEELAGVTQQQQHQRHKDKDGGSSSSTGNAAMYYLQSCNSDMLHVLWGRLACEILVLDWPAAAKAVEAVKTALESMVNSLQLTPLHALQQRTWLLHWSLFVYWNAPSGLEQLVDLFHSEKYKQAVTTVAPHLLRYLTAAVLLCKRREKAVPTADARKLVKVLVYVMQDCEYTDPIVEFVNCLCVKFDFDSAQQKLAVCEKVLSADFFLCHQTALFMEEARVFVFENYCRIHNKIDLTVLGEKLAMDQQQAERWIVDLIRNADLDAKIDSTAGCVVMGDSNPQSIYEQVMERTRDLNVRSATLTQNLSNVLSKSRKEKARKEQLSREED